MPYRDITSSVSKYLYENDPMYTSCVENEAIDEYDAIAVIITEEFEKNSADHWADLFDELFGDVPGDDILTGIVEIIEENLK